MNNLEWFVVEYKTTGEMFLKSFVWNAYKLEHNYHQFFNDATGEELNIYFEHLETLLTKPYIVNEN